MNVNIVQVVYYTEDSRSMELVGARNPGLTGSVRPVSRSCVLERYTLNSDEILHTQSFISMSCIGLVADEIVVTKLVQLNTLLDLF